MNKKGQIYILAALILSIVVFSLSQTINKFQQEELEEDFEKLSDNYELESSKLINSLINTEGNILDPFSKFTLLFTSYSKAQNPDFGLIYSLDYAGEVQIGNFLNQPIIVDNGTTSKQDLNTLNGCYDKISAVITFQGLSFDAGIDLKDIEDCTLTIPSTNNIWLQIGEFWYPFEIESGKPQIMIVSRLEAQEQRQVFVGGEGFVRKTASRPISAECIVLTRETSCESNKNCCWESSKKGKPRCKREGQCSEFGGTDNFRPLVEGDEEVKQIPTPQPIEERRTISNGGLIGDIQIPISLNEGEVVSKVHVNIFIEASNRNQRWTLEGYDNGWFKIAKNINEPIGRGNERFIDYTINRKISQLRLYNVGRDNDIILRQLDITVLSNG
jgi:hypothetical protein